MIILTKTHLLLIQVLILNLAQPGMQPCTISANITQKGADGSCTWMPFNASVNPRNVNRLRVTPESVEIAELIQF